MKALVQICLTSLASVLFVATAAAQPAPAAGEDKGGESGGGVVPTAAQATAAPTATDVPAAAAQPAQVDTARAPVNGDPGAAPTLKETCMAAINNDQQWTDELAAVIEKTVRFKVHNEEAELIAMNKRHVVMAYAVLWLFSIGFLIAQWRRQQVLKQQIESLKSDLAAAIKGSAT